MTQTTGPLPPLFRDLLAIRPADAALAATGLEEIARGPGPIPALRMLHSAGLLELPEVGSGKTWERWRALAEISAVDLSLGRLAEGHTDAAGIISEAGAQRESGLYGVWAAGHDVAFRCQEGAVHLIGARPYCSGASGLDRALLTGKAGDDEFLFDIDARQPAVVPLDGTWVAVGMAGSDSATVEFRGAITAGAIGTAGFYTGRPGFWQGSLNVAACWYGGALGLGRAAVAATEANPGTHQLAELGGLMAELMTMRQLLQRAARDTDGEPDDCLSRARDRALAVRHAIYTGCERVMGHAARAGGTGALGHDAAQARRMSDLPVYLRQHHPGPDLETAGKSLFGMNA